jgi:hypothetical protein
MQVGTNLLEFLSFYLARCFLGLYHLIAMGLRIVLRDRLGQYLVGLNREQ